MPGKDPSIKTRRWKALRLQVLQRDDWTCHYCGGPADTVDHVIPRSAGGAPYDPNNTVAACRSCNSAKGATTDVHAARRTGRRTPPGPAATMTTGSPFQAPAHP